ncbi:MAG: DUF4920 domain-containing protein [Nannocystis sp.]|nr:DUF4920 domain-containing protein [Nannocystis sp.]
MAVRIVSSTLACAFLLCGSLVACGGAPAQPQGEKVAAAAPAAPAVVEAAPAAADAKGEGEEGCIYGEKHEEKKGEGEEGCPHAEGGHGGAAGDGGHFGAAFAMSESKPLAEVLASAGAAPSESAVQVRGQIDTVCQKKGCWLVLKDGEQTARVLMKDHAFTVPMDSKGKPAVVEGTLASRTFNEKEVKHLEKDGGGDPAAVGGERTEYVLTASGIAITNS